METQDYYRVLGIDENAETREIKEAYRRLAFKFHPDRDEGDPAAMQRINEAYAVLSNSDKRAEYDSMRKQYGRAARDKFRRTYTRHDIYGGTDIHSIFEEMSRQFGYRSFDELFGETYGKDFKTFETRRPGIHIKGFFFAGTVPGIFMPLRSVFSSIGSQMLKLVEHVAGQRLPHKGRDIIENITLTPDQAFRGGPYAYLHARRAKKLVVKIPPRVRAGQRIRLAGMGDLSRTGGASGDLYLRVNIQQPLLSKLKQAVSKFMKPR